MLCLCGGGQEKKKPRRDTSSSSHRVTDGNDLADSDYEMQEERGSKKKSLHKPWSKRASNVVPNPYITYLEG